MDFNAYVFPGMFDKATYTPDSHQELIYIPRSSNT